MQSQQGIKQRQGIVERRVEGSDPRLNLRAPRGLVVGVLDTEIPVEQLQYRQISRRLAMRHRVGFEHLAIAWQHRLELIDQPRLAGSRLRHRGDNLTVTAARQLQRTLHLGNFALAPDELRQPAPRRQFEMTVQRSDTDHLVDVYRLFDAFDFSRTQLAQLEITFDQVPRIFADDYAARRRGRLHPRREVSCMSHRRVLGVPARVDHAENYFTGVDADADLDSRPALLFELLATTAKCVAHRERRVQRALWMVLMCDRRAEQSENAVAGGLHDVTVVAMRRVDHQLQRGVDNRAGLFRIEVAHQLGRALDVREQRRDRLALALDRLGSLPLRRDPNAAICSRCERLATVHAHILAELPAAISTELRARRVVRITVRTAIRQWAPALGAEFLAGDSLCTAFRAAHPTIPTHRAKPWHPSNRWCRNLR